MIKTFSFSSSGTLGPITTEQKLVGLSQQDAFACMYDAYVDRIQIYVDSTVANHQLAEDITARIFLAAWEKLPDYQTGKSPIIAWLYGIADDVVKDHCPAERSAINLHETNPVEISPEPDTQIGLPPSDEAALKSPEEQQQAMILKFLAGSQIWEGVGQPEPREAQVRSLKAQDLQRLVKRLAAMENEPVVVDSKFNTQSLAA